jgi:multidrug efflux pump subunit AcrB
LQKSNTTLASGSFSGDNKDTLVDTGGFLENAEAIKHVVVGVANGKPVYLSDVARVEDALNEPQDYVFMGLGQGAAQKKLIGNPKQDYAAVTISVAKRKGANATWVADDLLAKVESLKLFFYSTSRFAWCN